jgi:SAM-dependent methyltransferase
MAQELPIVWQMLQDCVGLCTRRPRSAAHTSPPSRRVYLTSDGDAPFPLRTGEMNGNDDIGEVIARGYDEVADQYAALESPDDPWPRMRRLRAFVGGLPRGAGILDLGCGNGLPATRALSEAYDVVGVDISPEQIARARVNVPTATFHCADVRNVELPSASFDAIVALYLVDNVPSEDYGVLFSRFSDWLVPGGRILLSAEPGNDQGRIYEWLGVPMFINTVAIEDVVAQLEAASFLVESVDTESQREGGRDIEFAWFTAEKPVAR